MPYVDQEARARLRAGGFPQNSGELNFAITTFCIQYLKDRGELRYSFINDVLGALEGAKLELYRRVAVPYENSKLRDNGDVYPPGLARGPHPRG